MKTALFAAALAVCLTVGAIPVAAAEGTLPNYVLTPWATEKGLFLSIDTSVGYLVNPDVTIRAGHAAIKGWTSDGFDGEAEVFERGGGD